MIEGRRITVVVPAHDEERLIHRALDGIPQIVDRIVVVDDASRDATVRRVRDHGDGRIHLISRSRNGGVGAAIRDGYLDFLAETSRTDAICVVMAGDAQMDPTDLAALLAPLLHHGAGYAKGNRLLTGDVRKVMPRSRFVGNVLFTMLTKIASGYWHVMDSQCGYTAITQEALSRVSLDNVYPRYGFPNDFLVKLNVAAVRVADVPVRAIYGAETSGIRPVLVVPRIAWLLLRGFWWRMWTKYIIRDFHPLVLLYLFGTVTSFLGVGMAIWITAMRWGSEAMVPTPATSVLTTLFILTGLQSLLFAMLFDMLYNQDLKVSP